MLLKWYEQLFHLQLVCRHHAARIANGEGTTQQFECPYHGWTYNLQGRLTKATKLKGIQDFEARRVCLPEIPCSTWGPLVGLGKSEPPEMKEFYTRLYDEFKMNEFKFHSKKTYFVKCGWKVIVDNYLVTNDYLLILTCQRMEDIMFHIYTKI